MSNYCGIVFEELLDPRTPENDVFFVRSDWAVYRLEGDSLTLASRVGDSGAYVVWRDGIWLHDSKTGIARFHPFVEGAYTYPAIDEMVWDTFVVIDEMLFGYRISFEKNHCLFRVDLRTGEKVVVPGAWHYLATDNDSIYAHDLKTGLIALTPALDEIWRVEFGERSWGNASPVPLLWQDVLVIPRNRQVLAFDKRTGASRWSRTLTTQPGSIALQDGRVYCEDNRDIVILDAETGDELVRTPTGYPEETRPGVTSPVGVYPCGDRLYAVRTYDPEIKFFSLDGQTCLQVLSLQETGYGASADTPPHIRNGVIFQDVRSGYSQAGRGTLMLRPAREGESLDICVLPRPPSHIRAVPALAEPHLQRVFVDGANLDEILRNMKMVVNELHFETGRIPQYNLKKGAFDYQHNGVIEVVVDSTPYGEAAVPLLEECLASIRSLFRTLGARNASKQERIQLELTLKPKAEWNLEGDPIDLDEARRIGKPISGRPTRKGSKS